MRAAARRAHDRRPLGSRFQDTCHQTREGGGLPEGSIIPPGITHDLVLQFDLPARRMEREERLLAFNGGDLNATLLEICREGRGKDARFLLANGANANLLMNNKGNLWYVIWHAARRGHLAVVEALLDAGAGELAIALCGAADRGQTAVVALLLDRGVSVHVIGDGPLYNAAHWGYLEMASLLLRQGADPEARRPDPPALGEKREFATPLIAAEKRGHDNVLRLLRERLMV